MLFRSAGRPASTALQKSTRGRVNFYIGPWPILKVKFVYISVVNCLESGERYQTCYHCHQIASHVRLSICILTFDFTSFRSRVKILCTFLTENSLEMVTDTINVATAVDNEVIIFTDFEITYLHLTLARC